MTAVERAAVIYEVWCHVFKPEPSWGDEADYIQQSWREYAQALADAGLLGCPHVATSDEGTSYCTLAEQRSAAERAVIEAAKAVAHAASTDDGDLHHLHPCCEGTTSEKQHYWALLDKLCATVDRLTRDDLMAWAAEVWSVAADAPEPKATEPDGPVS